MKSRLPVVALVGRPNVGKSRLFNRFVRSRMAIVENTPGVTRDRNYGTARWNDCRFTVIDTGGFEPESTDILLEQMRVQAQLAVEEADVILFVVDSRAGLLPADSQIADILRRSNKRVIVTVNKIDQPKHIELSYEFYELAFDEMMPVSAHTYKIFLPSGVNIGIELSPAGTISRITEPLLSKSSIVVMFSSGSIVVGRDTTMRE